ncbi:hypothetical protein WJX74_009473 [Apatococcus lobatus]|uniref:Uncharacterized protein n=1 Tax=Apatococcus lobatus TaxID=904363 RepID=A0AAW1S7P0_9CHLO
MADQQEQIHAVHQDILLTLENHSHHVSSGSSSSQVGQLIIHAAADLAQGRCPVPWVINGKGPPFHDYIGDVLLPNNCLNASQDHWQLQAAPGRRA